MYMKCNYRSMYVFKERQITEKKNQCRPAFEGPFCRALDDALALFKVHREAYYGGTFTGNHAHKCLKVSCPHRHGNDNPVL